MTDRRAGTWLGGLVLGIVSGSMFLTLGSRGLIFALASLGLILWKGPRPLATTGLLTGVGLIWAVLFVRVALTCGGPFDLGVSTCMAPDLSGWIATGLALFALGLVASAFALQRTRR